MSEASIRTQWKKGQSGNPKGRPKKPKPLSDQGQMLTSIARVLLDRPCYLLGSDEPVTRLTRFLLDLIAQAENGDRDAAKYLLDLAMRGDRLRLQALRAARRARTKDEAAFERRNAERVSPRTPGLRPDQEHLILPARQLHAERPKPAKPVPKRQKFNDEDLLEELRISSLQEKAEKLKKQRLALEAEVASLEREVETAQKSRPETGPITGVKTGPITGVENAVRPPQAIDGAGKSSIRIGDGKSFVVPPATIDGAPTNGAHHNGSYMNGAHG